MITSLRLSDIVISPIILFLLLNMQIQDLSTILFMVRKYSIEENQSSSYTQVANTHVFCSVMICVITSIDISVCVCEYDRPKRSEGRQTKTSAGMET